MPVPVKQLEKAFSYSFTDQGLAQLALTHSSAGALSNERLEFLGDAILGFVIAAELYARYPEAPEGELSRMRASLVNQHSLAGIATSVKLGELLILGPGELKSGGRTRASILSDAVEAVLGAIYIDGGLESARQTVLKIYGELLDNTGQAERGKDSKTRLQEFLQSKSLPLPLYEVLSIEGEDHLQTFVVACQIDLLKQATNGCGSNRKLAEQQAAEKALLALGL
tara:strand:- start:782 stop:1456 length:675 start_codon:yes stop_codon:yes gene_type:complete